MRHVAHGPHLRERLGAHGEDGIREVRRAFPEAREQAVFSQQAAGGRIKPGAAAHVVILPEAQALKTFSYMRLLITGVPIRPGFAQAGEALGRKHARRDHDRQARGLPERGHQFRQPRKARLLHIIGVFPEGEIEQMYAVRSQTARRFQQFIGGLAVAGQGRIAAAIMAKGAVVAAMGAQIEEPIKKNL